MVGSRWLKILCHYPYQEVDIISPPFESGLAPSVEPIGCRRTALSSSRPSLSEDCTFCFFFLGVLALGTLPLGTQLPCWEGPKPHTHTQSPAASINWQPHGGAVLDVPAQSHPDDITCSRSSPVKARPHKRTRVTRENKMF